MLAIANYYFFFFNDTATTEIYTLPYTTLFRSGRTQSALLSDPHSLARLGNQAMPTIFQEKEQSATETPILLLDRKSTRLNSSHVEISYAVFCLKKKKKSK